METQTYAVHGTQTHLWTKEKITALKTVAREFITDSCIEESLIDLNRHLTNYDHQVSVYHKLEEWKYAVEAAEMISQRVIMLCTEADQHLPESCLFTG